MFLNVLVLTLALATNTLVFSKIASVLMHTGAPTKRRALETTTSPRVMDVTISRHVALHS